MDPLGTLAAAPNDAFVNIASIGQVQTMPAGVATRQQQNILNQAAALRAQPGPYTKRQTGLLNRAGRIQTRLTNQQNRIAARQNTRSVTPSSVAAAGSNLSTNGSAPDVNVPAVNAPATDYTSSAGAVGSIDTSPAQATAASATTTNQYLIIGGLAGVLGLAFLLHRKK